MRRLALYLGALALALGLLLWAFTLAALDKGKNAELILSLNGAENTGLSEEDVVAASNVLMEYLRGGRADIELTAEVYGVEQPVYNAREIAHMEDVWRLFALERRVRWTLCGIGVALLALGLFAGGSPRAFGRMGLWALSTVLALLGGFALFAAVDFSAVFLWFHSVAFTNDLWLLDPATDLMIRMLPEPFFSGVCLRAGLYMALAFAGMAVVCAFCAFHRWRIDK